MIPLVQTAVNRFIVSTVYSSDCGWETAIVGQQDQVIPVARYVNLEDAHLGHKEWVTRITGHGPVSLPVVKLDWGDLVDAEMRFVEPMELERYKKAVKGIIPDLGGSP